MDMGGGNVMLMPPPSWSVGYAAITFAMWSIMMIAMMTPSAAPELSASRAARKDFQPPRYSRWAI